MSWKSAWEHLPLGGVVDTSSKKRRVSKTAHVCWGTCEAFSMPNSHLGPNSVFSPPDDEIGCPSKVKDTKSKGLTHTNGDLAALLSLLDCWIAGTGCGHDLLAKRLVDEVDKARLFESPSPLLWQLQELTFVAEQQLCQSCQSPA